MDYEYKELLKRVLRKGKLRTDRTGVGTRSTFGESMDLDMRGGCFPLLSLKRVAFRWCFEETMWFLSGSRWEQDLRARGVDIWKEWATAEQCAKFNRAEGDMGHIYGPLWRNFSGQSTENDDQIAKLIQECVATPDSRRLIVTGWNPNECRNVALPPCHTLWQVYIDGDEISLQLYARSIDIVLGLPFDAAMYGLLLFLIARAVGKKPGMLHIRFGDLHIYNNHMEAVELMLLREERRAPMLRTKACYQSGLAAMLATKFEDLELIGYEPHPKIVCEVAV